MRFCVVSPRSWARSMHVLQRKVCLQNCFSLACSLSLPTTHDYQCQADVEFFPEKSLRVCFRFWQLVCILSIQTGLPLKNLTLLVQGTRINAEKRGAEVAKNGKRLRQALLHTGAENQVFLKRQVTTLTVPQTRNPCCYMSSRLQISEHVFWSAALYPGSPWLTMVGQKDTEELTTEYSANRKK